MGISVGEIIASEFPPGTQSTGHISLIVIDKLSDRPMVPVTLT